jgi:hypothetical protein
MAHPEAGLKGIAQRLAEGPLLREQSPRTWVSPYSASEQTRWSRLLTGRGGKKYGHYVEFDASAGETAPVGGFKRVLGLGWYQEYFRGPVRLEGRNAVFGAVGDALVVVPHGAVRLPRPDPLVVGFGMGHVTQLLIDDDE